MRTCDINPPAKSEWTLKEILDEIDDAAINLPKPTYWGIREDILEIWKRYGGEKSKPRWTPVTERLPEKVWANYLVFNGRKVCEAVFTDAKWVDPVEEWDEYEGITHWMALPEPPEVDL